MPSLVINTAWNFKKQIQAVTTLHTVTRGEDTKPNGTLSMMDCICDLWTRSPYNREDHCSGEIRRPASIAMWTICASCSLLRASYVRNSSLSCIREESSSRFVTWWWRWMSERGDERQGSEKKRQGHKWPLSPIRLDRQKKKKNQTLTRFQNKASCTLVYIINSALKTEAQF